MASKKKAAAAPTGVGKGNWSRRNFAPVIFLSIEENGVFKDADDLYGKMTSFKVKEQLTKATETHITFRNDDIELAEDPRFLANTVWKFRFGYYNDLSPIMVGIIRNIEPEYGEKATIKVTLYDYTLNASQTSSAKNWGKIKTNEIAKQIAKKHNMKASVDDSNDLPKKAWIQPSDLNDIQFLRDLAALIDFEVYVSDDPPTLFYRKKAYDASPKGQLIYYNDPSEFAYLKSFKPKVTSLGPYNSGVKGTDAEKGKGDKATVGDGSKQSPGLGNRDNYRVLIGRQRDTGTGGGQSAEVVVKPVATSAPANTNTQKLAQVKRQQILDKANEATSEHPLTPSLSKGLIFEILGIEKPLAGKWYVYEADHEITGTNAGTRVTWKRNSTNGNKNQQNVNNKNAGGSGNAGPHVIVGRERDSGGGNQTSEVIQRNQPVPAPQGLPQPVPK